MSTIKVANVSFDASETNKIEYKQDQVVRVTSTGALRLPVGGTITRPSVAESGLFRYNSDTASLEFRNSSTWIKIPNYTIAGSTVTPSGGQDGDVWYRV